MDWRCILSLLLVSQVVKGERIVLTHNGPLRGTTVASGKVQAFLGIPYAEPPIGPLRFAKPLPKPYWSDVYDATRLPPPCIQANLSIPFYAPDTVNMSEDCLYLNVWSPVSTADELKPVMFFIHGGGLYVRSSSMKIYDGTKLSEHGDVVVVTINYRLGALGFFTGFIDEAPGSIGLYDQVMAMQWVKKNAKYFHGDPDNIVLFGESAGAFSVSMHQISPLSKGLFSRAILQSGSSINPWYIEGSEQFSKTCHRYAEMLGCTSDGKTLKENAKEIVDCLKNVPAMKFSEADFEIMKTALVLYPVTGNDFLPISTIEAYRQGEFKNSEVLMGVTKDEGSILLHAVKDDLFGQLGKININQLFPDEATAYSAIRNLITGDPSIADDIISGYLKKVNMTSSYTYLSAVIEAVGDSLITCSNVFQAEYQSLRGNPVYFYKFDHRHLSSYLPEWMGVAHFDDVQFVFGNSMYRPFTECEEELSNDIMNMWVSFAKTGNPINSEGMAWPRFTFQDPKYFIIGKRNSIGVRPDHYRCERWRRRYQSIIDDIIIQTLRKK